MTTKSASPASPGEKPEIPSCYYCPISKQIMVDPVFIESGHTYERKYIEQWFSKSDIDPYTGLKVKHKIIIPNYALREAIEHYLKENPQVSDEDYLKACADGDVDKVKQCLFLGADVNAVQKLPSLSTATVMNGLFYAINNNSVELCKLLIGKGINKEHSEVPKKNQTAILHACKKATPAIVDLLLRCGVKYDKNKLLEVAVDYSKAQVVDYLLKNFERFEKKEILLSAFKKLHQIDILERIMKQLDGASLELRDKAKRTVLHNMMIKGDAAVVKHFITKYNLQKLIHAEDQSGQTPLFCGTNVAAKRLLLEQGADVDHQDAKKRTPLHALITCEKIETAVSVSFIDQIKPFSANLMSQIQLLLEYGADVDIKNDEDKTPMELANAKKWETIVEKMKAAKLERKVMMKQIPMLFKQLKEENEQMKKQIKCLEEKLSKLAQ